MLLDHNNPSQISHNPSLQKFQTNRDNRKSSQQPNAAGMPSPSIVLNAVRKSQKLLPQVDFSKMKTRTSRNIHNFEQSIQQLSAIRNKKFQTNADETANRTENVNGLISKSYGGHNLEKLRASQHESPP